MCASQHLLPAEGALSLLQVTLASDPAEHLECLARDLGQRVGLRRLQRAAGEVGCRGQLTLADRGVGGAGIDLRQPGSRRAAGDLDARGRIRPSRAGDGGPRDLEVQVRGAGRGNRVSRVQPGEQYLAHLDRAVDLAGHRQDLGQCRVDRSAEGGVLGYQRARLL